MQQNRKAKQFVSLSILQKKGVISYQHDNLSGLGSQCQRLLFMLKKIC